jgi:hypothetical protein
MARTKTIARLPMTSQKVVHSRLRKIKKAQMATLVGQAVAQRLQEMRRKGKNKLDMEGASKFLSEVTYGAEAAVQHLPKGVTDTDMAWDENDMPLDHKAELACVIDAIFEYMAGMITDIEDKATAEEKRQAYLYLGRDSDSDSDVESDADVDGAADGAKAAMEAAVVAVVAEVAAEVVAPEVAPEEVAPEEVVAPEEAAEVVPEVAAEVAAEEDDAAEEEDDEVVVVGEVLPKEVVAAEEDDEVAAEEDDEVAAEEDDEAFVATTHLCLRSNTRWFV